MTNYCIGSYQECDVVNFLTNSENILLSPIEIKIFPNPAYSYLNVQTSLDEVDIFVINSMGQKISNRSMNRETQMDISNYPNGVYYVQFYKDGQLLKTEKFVVLK